MKLHQNIVNGIIECLNTIFQEHKYTDDVLEKAFKNHKQWGSRDRKFIGTSVYECVRWWRYFNTIGSADQSALQLSEKALAVYFIKNEIELPLWYPLQGLTKDDILSKLSQVTFERKITESIPDWLDEMGEKELGEKWATELKALNQQAKVAIRINSLNTSTEELTESLAAQEIEVEEVPHFEDALLLVKRQNLGNLEEYKQGLFEIQDIGSQAIAPYLEAKPGMTVIDACAGGGGKTLHLAALMQNQGQIIAMDVEQRKLDNLKQRATRAGTVIVQTDLISEETLQKYQSTADRLLLDVPCSGLGVLKRNPDSKWKLSVHEIEKVRAIQHTILHTYPTMLKKGGILVYATCSILPSENKSQVEKFLAAFPHEYELLAEQQIWPSEGFDGFYIARILKK